MSNNGNEDIFSFCRRKGSVSGGGNWQQDDNNQIENGNSPPFLSIL